MKELITQELRKYNPNFSNVEIATGLSLFEEKNFKSKDVISKAGEVAQYLFFAEQSITRC